jgi:outer membrane protein assembly factor BamB
MVALVLMILPRTSSQSPKQQPRRTQQGYSIDYHRNPQFHWMIRLEDDESLLHGNAIVQSPYDDNVVYVTTHSGKLVVLSAQDGSTIATVTPKPRSLTEDGKTDTWSANCSSGVTFGELKNGDKFVAYSINDVPPEGSLYGLKT